MKKLLLLSLIAFSVTTFAQENSQQKHVSGSELNKTIESMKDTAGYVVKTSIYKKTDKRNLIENLSTVTNNKGSFYPASSTTTSKDSHVTTGFYLDASISKKAGVRTLNYTVSFPENSKKTNSTETIDNKWKTQTLKIVSFTDSIALKHEKTTVENSVDIDGTTYVVETSVEEQVLIN